MKTISAAGLLALAMTSAHAEWVYTQDTDPMTSKPVRRGSLQSTNTLNLKFPYQGTNYGVLEIRQHPKYGLNAIVSIDKGQILCPHYDGCAVSVRFDDGKPLSFQGAASSDRSSNIVFLSPASRFIASAQKAKRILVQVSLFQAGDQVLEFKAPTPLQWQATDAAQKNSGTANAQASECRKHASKHVAWVRQRYMSVCMKSGVAAAELEQQPTPTTPPVEWPSPPANLTGN